MKSLAAIILLGIFVLELAFSIRHQSQTYDEGFHLVAGYRYWQCGDFGINSEHPPLVKFVADAPLRLGHVPAPQGECGNESTAKDDGYDVGLNYLYRQGLDADSLLYRARLAAGVFGFALALACFVCAWSMFGETAGLIALLIVVFEPNVLAHGALITTDAAVSAFMLWAVFAFWRFEVTRSTLWLIATGVFTGLTLASKHSGVLVIPILVVLAAIELVWQRAARTEQNTATRSLAQQVVRRACEVAAILLIGTSVLWCFYGLRFAPRPAGQPMTTELNDFIAQVQDQGVHGFILTRIIPGLAHWHLLPEAYLYGLVDVLSVSSPGQPPFLLGKLYPHGRWFYFPIAFVIKTTLGFLALLVLAFIPRNWNGQSSRDEGRPLKLCYLIVPPLIVLLVAMQSGLNIGIRHVLPMFGFLIVLISGTAVQLFARNRLWRFTVWALLAIHAASSLHSYPNYLPYSNEAFGGTYNTYRYLTDSNVDWGQGVYQTRDYLSRHNIQDCWLAYDGAVLLSYYHLPCKELSGSSSIAGTIPPTSVTGTFVLSDLSISGIEWETPELNPYRVFLPAQPIANIGGGVLVYRGTFDLSGVIAVASIARSNQERESNASAALADAQIALSITPQSVRAQLALGRSLAALGRKDEARSALHAALAQAQKRGAEWYPGQIADIRWELENL